MKYDFETLVDRRRAGALKMDLMRQAQPNAPEDAVPLWRIWSLSLPRDPGRRCISILMQIPGYSGAPEEIP